MIDSIRSPDDLKERGTIGRYREAVADLRRLKARIETRHRREWGRAGSEDIPANLPGSDMPPRAGTGLDDDQRN